MGRETTLWQGWLTRGVRLAATACKAGRRAGVSSALGWLAGPGAAARLGQVCLRLRGPAKPGRRAGPAGGRRQAGPDSVAWAGLAFLFSFSLF